jgi:hypothetical protein
MAFRRSVLAQMIICGIIALLGPGLWVGCHPSSQRLYNETDTPFENTEVVPAEPVDKQAALEKTQNV